MAKRTASTRNDKTAFYQHNRKNPQKHRRLRNTKAQAPASATCTAQSDDEIEQIMLPTAIVYVMDNKDGRHEYRALLDQGSH